MNLIAHFEGLRLKAYQDSAGIWTIGIGTTRYASGARVKRGDEITEQEAYRLLSLDVAAAGKSVDDLTRDDITQNQFDALTSFVYNLGRGSYSGSTLRNKVNRSPDDPTIRDEFTKWIYAGGKKLTGLLNRRKAEADLYFKK